MITVRLSEEDVDRAWAFALAMAEQSRGSESGYAHFDELGLDVVEANCHGACAEIAVAYLFEQRWDKDPHAGRDGGGDLLVDGHSFQVKFTFTRSGHFAIPPWETLRAQYGVLVVPGSFEREYGLAAWITQGAFNRLARVKDFGYPFKPLAVAQDDMRPIEELHARWLRRRVAV